MQKGFLDTALRITAIATMIVVIVCTAAFGLAKFRVPSERLADKAKPDTPIVPSENSSANGAGRRPPAGPDPLADHLDKLGKRLEELTKVVSSERSAQTEIARLADSMQIARQKADLSDTKLGQELSNLRVSNEVELRDLNRQIGDVSEKSRQLEREMIEQRAGILTALESQKSTIASQVARLEGSLDDVHSELTELRTNSQSALASMRATQLQPVNLPKSLAPVPNNHPTSTENDAAWKEPVVLDSSASVESSSPDNSRSLKTATSTGWKVSPMSHSIPQPEPQAEISIPKLSLPPAPPAESMPAVLPPLPENSSRASSGIIRLPMRSTLAPTVSTQKNRVPEIFEPPTSAKSNVRQVAAISSETAVCSPRKYEIQTTVIHLAASRPVDVEPAGVRMLNPELSSTAYGQPWTHNAVTHELLRKISLRTEASIAGRQKKTITSSETAKLSIGSSCPHCNEVHGFEAGDRLILQAGPACDKVQRFHVVSEVSGGGNELDSLSQFDLTPMTNQTYVICEEAVEGTVEETIAETEEKLVPIHGVLTPVSGPAETQVSTQLMQRVVVMTFRDVSADPIDRVATAASNRMADTEKKPTLTKLALPAPEPPKQVAIKQLTPVKQHPIFLPPPAPANATKAPRRDSSIEYVATRLVDDSSIQQANHERGGDYCEVCQQTHESDTGTTPESSDVADRKKERSLLDWFRRVRSESSDSKPEVQTADFQQSESENSVSKTASKTGRAQRGIVKKPGKRLPVR